MNLLKKPLLPCLALLSFLCASLSLAQSASPAAPATTIPDDRNFTTRPEYQTSWDDYLALQKGKQFDLVFIGDSITQQWRWGQGRPVWQKFFASRALNFGQGADKTQNTLWRLKNLPVRDFKPRIAVILIGTNNTQDTPEDIAAGVKAVISTTRETFGTSKIVLVSILPNKRANEKMMATNTLIRGFADEKSVYFLDLAAKFTPEGDSWTGLQKDKLHLTEQGYQTWAAELLPLLEKMQ